MHALAKMSDLGTPLGGNVGLVGHLDGQQHHVLVQQCADCMGNGYRLV
jgi:hypothetical protein